MKIQFAIMVYFAAFTGFLTAAKFTGDMRNGEYYESNTVEVIMKEIKEGGFIHKTGDYGNMPIHFAAKYGRVDVAKKLFDLDKNLANIPNSQGKRPLFVAVEKGEESMVKYLLEREKSSDKKNVNEKIGSKDAPLHMAAQNGFANIAELLLANGAKIDEKDGLSKTPLLIAATCGNINVMEILLNHKPTPANAEILIQHLKNGFLPQNVKDYLKTLKDLGLHGDQN